MQETLDPNIGENEIADFKKEIHRMELRLDDLRKKQETIILEMERAVYKKETIDLKYVIKNPINPKDKKTTKKNIVPQVKKEIQKLKDTIGNSMQRSKQIDMAIKQQSSQLDIVNQQIEEANKNYSEIENQINEKNMQLIENKVNKVLSVFQISEMQTIAKKYDELLNKSAKLALPESQLKKKYDEQKDINNKICEAFNKVINEFPQYSSFFKNLINSRNILLK